MTIFDHILIKTTPSSRAKGTFTGTFSIFKGFYSNKNRTIYCSNLLIILNCRRAESNCGPTDYESVDPADRNF